MGPLRFEDCCFILYDIAYAGMQSASISSHQLKNLVQGCALSAVFAVGKLLITHQSPPITIVMAIALTPLAINRLAFLAQNQNYLSSDQMEAIERNFTKWLDIIRIASSTAMLILLTSQTKKSNIAYFGLGVFAVGLDLGLYIKYSNQQAIV